MNHLRFEIRLIFAHTKYKNRWITSSSAADTTALRVEVSPVPSAASTGNVPSSPTLPFAGGVGGAGREIDVRKGQASARAARGTGMAELGSKYLSLTAQHHEN